MGISSVFFAICSRGLSKTFIVGLGAIVKMNLYPYSEVVITSSTIPQANKMVEDKIRDEIIKKLSDYLLYMYEKEYLVITKPEDGYKIENKLNGSIMRILPCQDSSRGPRATLLVYEECRLLKKSMIDSVFEKMAHPRQAKYMSNPVYGENPRWKEECQHIYITSARYRFEWFWGLFKKTFVRHFMDKKSSCNIFAGDIFTAIANGFKTWGDYRNGRAGGEMDFRMEDLNEMVSEAEDSFFTIESFKKNQVLEEAFQPPTINDIFQGKEISFSDKKANEIRLLVTDLAFSGNNSKEKNDNTVFLCVSLHWTKRGFERHLDYVETAPGGEAPKRVLRLRELFEDYQADYLVDDNRSGGEVYYDYLTCELEHPQRGWDWNISGLTVVNESDLHVVQSGKVEELKFRTIDKNARKVIIPVIGTTDINSNAWKALKRSLESNMFKFLISESDKQNMLEDSGEYFDLSADEYAKRMLPHIQTEMLIQECVNLQAEYRDGRVKLKEPRSGYKDRAVALSYANLIADKIENKYFRKQQKQEYDLTQVQLVW